MANKFAVITDTHMGVRGDSDIFAEYQMRGWQKFFDHVKSEGIKSIIHAGDFFDNRSSLKLQTINRTQEFLNMLDGSGATLYLLVGNHDVAYKNNNTLNSPELLFRFDPNVIVFDSGPETITVEGVEIDMIPWINNSTLSESIEFINNSKSRVCVGHFEIAGAPFHKGGHVSEEGINPGVFSTYDLTLSGHYHTRSYHGKRNNVVFIRAGFEYTWADCDDPRGYSFVDSKTLELQDYNWEEKMFFRGKYENDILTLQEANYKDKFVRIDFVSGDNKKFEKAIAKITEQQPAEFQVIITDPDLSSSALQEGISESEDNPIQVYVDGISDLKDSQKDELKKYLQELKKEAEEL